MKSNETITIFFGKKQQKFGWNKFRQFLLLAPYWLSLSAYCAHPLFYIHLLQMKIFEFYWTEFLGVFFAKFREWIIRIFIAKNFLRNFIEFVAACLLSYCCFSHMRISTIHAHLNYIYLSIRKENCTYKYIIHIVNFYAWCVRSVLIVFVFIVLNIYFHKIYVWWHGLANG